MYFEQFEQHFSKQVAFQKEARMKTLKVILLVMAAVLVLPTYTHASTLGSVRISFLEGDVQMRTIEAGDWVPAAVNTPLDEGDELWVPEGGRLEIQLNTGTSVRLDQNSALEILTLERTSSQFYLSEGHVYVDHNAARGNVVQFDTPLSSVRAYDRSVFRVDVSAEFTDVSVYRGSVDAEGREGRTRVNAGRTLTLEEGREAELTPHRRPDDWENWNRERDRRFASRRDSYRYLPEELRTYSTDFDDGGSWIQVREYGYVWTPRVVSSRDWAPYRTGRWMWRGGDYIWVSYEPWGWAPYHYGRWAFVPRIGWFWVPPPRGEVYWGPGYVGWVRTADHVAWVPLAPREVYYGRGDYGPHSVDIRKRDRREINITNITYRNVQVNNSVTVINHNTFVTGRREAVNVKQNLFLTEKVNIGSPEIKPERASFAPVVKTIQPARLPPQHVNKIEVKELKQRRSLVKEPDKSVINRDEPAKPLVVKLVDQPKSRDEKAKERQQRRLEKDTAGAPAKGPVAKGEEKDDNQLRSKGKDRQVGPETKPAAEVERKGGRGTEEKRGAVAVAPKTKERKGGRESGPAEAAQQSKTTPAEKAKEPQQANLEKGKTGTIETKETKGRRQLGPAEKSVAGPGGVAETRGEGKGGKQTVAEESRKSTEQEAKVEKRANREAREDNRQIEKLEDDFRAERISRKEYDNRKKRIADGAILY